MKSDLLVKRLNLLVAHFGQCTSSSEGGPTGVDLSAHDGARPL